MRNITNFKHIGKPTNNFTPFNTIQKKNLREVLHTYNISPLQTPKSDTLGFEPNMWCKYHKVKDHRIIGYGASTVRYHAFTILASPLNQNSILGVIYSLTWTCSPEKSNREPLNDRRSYISCFGLSKASQYKTSTELYRYISTRSISQSLNCTFTTTG